MCLFTDIVHCTLWACSTSFKLAIDTAKRHLKTLNRHSLNYISWSLHFIKPLNSSNLSVLLIRFKTFKHNESIFPPSQVSSFPFQWKHFFC